MANTRDPVRQSHENVELVRLLGLAGWTPEDLGDRLNRLAVAMELREHINRKSVRRWVHAMPSRPIIGMPAGPWPALVCHLLHERTGEPVTLEMLGWTGAAPLRVLPADHGLNQPWNCAGAIDALTHVMDAGPMGMERRHFLALTGMSLTTVAHQWLRDPGRVAASLRGTRVDHALVDDFELVTEAHRRMDDAIGGVNLLPVVREHLRLVVGLLNNAAYTEEVGKRLHAVAAELGRLAGWLSYDTNQEAAAQRYFMTALRAAHVSGDRAIGANILGYMSLTALTGSPRDAVDLAESALLAERELTPTVAASLYGRLAAGAGGTGDELSARRALTRSFELLSSATPKEEPPWIYYWTECAAASMAGVSLVALDRPADAEPYLRQAVSMIGSEFPRDRGLMLLSLATARLGAGSVERACATATEAAEIVRRLDSPRGRRRLSEFRAAARPYASSAAVKEFDVKYRDLKGV